MINLQTGAAILVCLCGLVTGRTLRHHNADHVSDTKILISSNFIGEATNELATAMLQESLEEEGNYVFSPIGYSTILAILTEGARGETRTQLAKNLHLPEDLAAVRQAYKNLLHRMKDKGEHKPEFKNWFYAYRNYSIQTQYKEVLLENYLTEVKAVEFDYYDNTAEDQLLDIDKKKNAIKEIVMEKGSDNKEEADDKINKIVQDDKKVKDDIEAGETVQQTVSDKKTEEEVNAGKEGEKEEKKEVEKNKPETQPAVEMKDKVEEQKKENVDNDDFQENKNINKIETEREMETTQKENLQQVPKVETTTVADGISQNTKDQETDSKQKETLMSEENKVDSKRSRKTKGRRYFLNKDTVTALTANRLSSTRNIEGDGDNSTKRIIIFNGFYYKGNWTVEFHAKNDDSPEGKTFFYTSESEKKPAKMMTTIGEFEIGLVPELESTALELPYQGDKYSLLVLLPNNRNGLKKLASDLENFSLPKIDQYLTKKEVQVCLPKVNFYTISKPKAALLKRGVTNLFNKDADLSGINAEGGLYLDELVQLVTMNFEETSTATNFLTSTLAVTRSNSNPEQFNANHPFFFFLRERQDGIILAAGKLQDPTNTSHDH